MFATLDILIGVSVVMLMVSLGVTLLTEVFINLSQRRGVHLRRGIADLLEQIQPGIERKTLESIATCVLQHPLIRGSKRRLGTVIKREELTKLLMELASPKAASTLNDHARTALVTALKDNGIEHPEELLRTVRFTALRLEQSNPALANTVRQNIALLQSAESEFLAKMNAWFDQTMDRVSERFTLSTRALTMLSATILAVAIQLDTVQLVNRLSMDPEMRRSFVAQAVAVKGNATGAVTNGKLDLNDPQVRGYYDFLTKAGLVFVPSNLDEWNARWATVNPLGVVLSILLLSLGGPFWYGALNRMLQLRSVLAQKDDAERTERQTTQVPRAAVVVEQDRRV